MSAPLPTRQQIDAAGEIDWQSKRKPDLTITVRCHVDGFDTEVCFTGSIDQLLATTKRLRELGAEPASATVQAPAPVEKRKAERVEPLYKPDGTACCPVHKRALSDGAHGLFCSAKATGEQVADRKGYCGLRFAE
jgi:hypothetical protein